MLFEPLFKNAQAKPTQIAVTDESGQFTWQDLATKSVGLGMYIGMQTQKDKIGLLLPAGGAFYVSFFGAILAGKTVVPINFLLGDKETAHVITDSGIDTVITIPLLAKKLENSGLNVIDITALAKSAPSLPEGFKPTFPNPKPDDLAVIMYTSGTSGLPKGVMLTYNNLHSDVLACIEHVQLSDEHKFLGLVPLFHSTGMLATLIAPVYLGAPVVYLGRFSPVATIKAIRDHKTTVLVAVPSMYGALLRLKDASPEDFAHVYACISGGEPLPEAIRKAFLEKFKAHLFEGYGLTETIGPICVNTPQKHREGSVGKLIPCAQVRITSPEGAALPVNESGEVQIKGSMVMAGYYNLPDETKKVMTDDGYFKTGDLGKLDSDGYLHITGRLKEIIITSGEKVVPREVEDAIAKHPAVADVSVVGKKDPSRGEAVVAFVVPKEGQQVTEQQIKDAARDAGLIQWKIPRDVRIVQDLPRSPTGKVLKRVLVEQLNNEPVKE